MTLCTYNFYMSEVLLTSSDAMSRSKTKGWDVSALLCLVNQACPIQVIECTYRPACHAQRRLLLTPCDEVHFAKGRQAVCSRHVLHLCLNKVADQKRNLGSCQEGQRHPYCYYSKHLGKRCACTTSIAQNRSLPTCRMKQSDTARDTRQLGLLSMSFGF